MPCWLGALFAGNSAAQARVQQLLGSGVEAVGSVLGLGRPRERGKGKEEGGDGKAGWGSKRNRAHTRTERARGDRHGAKEGWREERGARAEEAAQCTAGHKQTTSGPETPPPTGHGPRATALAAGNQQLHPLRATTGPARAAPRSRAGTPSTRTLRKADGSGALIWRWCRCPSELPSALQPAQPPAD